MKRLLARTVRLLKFGAVAGALVGVGRLVLKRRRQAEVSESSWPTIAETAAQNGQPLDDDADGAGDDEAGGDADADGAEDAADESAGAGDTDEDKD